MTSFLLISFLLKQILIFKMLHLEGNNLERAFSFKVGSAYSCIDDVLTLMIKVVNGVSVKFAFFLFLA